jgi:hypothetical protein
MGDTSSSPLSTVAARVDETETDAETQAIPIHFLQGALDDTLALIKTMSTNLRFLPRPQEIVGITLTSEETVKSMHSLVDGNIRSRYARSLEQPSHTQLKPDACILFEKLKNSAPMESASMWFDYFSQNCPAWENTAAWFQNKKKRKKSSGQHSSELNNGGGGIADGQPSSLKGNDKDNSEDMLLLKCRFVSALNDLEKAGFIHCQRRGSGGEIVIRRQVAHWV